MAESDVGARPLSGGPRRLSRRTTVAQPMRLTGSLAIAIAAALLMAPVAAADPVLPIQTGDVPDRSDLPRPYDIPRVPGGIPDLGPIERPDIPSPGPLGIPVPDGFSIPAPETPSPPETGPLPDELPVGPEDLPVDEWPVDPDDPIPEELPVDPNDPVPGSGPASGICVEPQEEAPFYDVVMSDCRDDQPGILGIPVGSPHWLPA